MEEKLPIVILTNKHHIRQRIFWWDAASLPSLLQAMTFMRWWTRRTTLRNFLEMKEFMSHATFSFLHSDYFEHNSSSSK